MYCFKAEYIIHALIVFFISKNNKILKVPRGIYTSSHKFMDGKTRPDRKKRSHRHDTSEPHPCKSSAIHLLSEYVLCMVEL